MKKNYIKIFLLGAAITSLLSSCGDGDGSKEIPKTSLPMNKYGTTLP